eukprot:TRINITY_DN5030_c0_g1_i1.p1 TRINITY_DN5030_c0_g1~~TRINITY_DN5030_c0_g1_i1.p1  ORF type:complete len:407 (+),score=60.00 TRINITY_DN5030_c0_g1_i1:47-1222(+)
MEKIEQLVEKLQPLMKELAFWQKPEIVNLTMNDVWEYVEDPSMPTQALMIIAATLIIWVGSSWSVTKQQRAKAKGETDDTKEESVHLSSKEAAIFPFIGSAVLLSLYICYKIFPKEYFNTVITLYFTIISIYATAEFLNFFLTYKPLSACVAIALATWWWFTSHFVANNIIATAICLTGLKQMKVQSFAVCWILLWGLFIYDVWWVFATEVMVSVAKNIEAPVLIKLPRSLTAEEWKPADMMMLGLGDIVLPGFYVAMCLRFDYNRAALRLEAGKRKADSGVCPKYFGTCLFAYTCGLINTMFMMHVFKHAQPALLYLVPWTTFLPFLVALLTGELPLCWRYTEGDDEEKKDDEEDDEEDLSYFQMFYNLTAGELFGAEMYRGVKKSKKNE